MPGIEQAVSSPTAAARVDEILRAACRVVVTGDASDLRIGTVAQEAGVSRTLVHYYFTTRQELLREAELATLATGAERAERALVRTIDPLLEGTRHSALRARCDRACARGGRPRLLQCPTRSS
jgi:AcrR family transcriptional regulator